MNSATATMIDGIKESCRAWGRAMRWVLADTNEDYPSMATMERAKGGELDAKATTVRQRFGEVLCGDALAISRAIRTEPRMPEESYAVLFAHYVVPHKDGDRNEITVRRKARDLGFDTTRPYYTALDCAYHFLLARVPVANVSHGTVDAHSVPTQKPVHTSQTA
jgi:hypothetical protein